VNERRIETAKNIAVSYRNYRRARDRALARLANAYPENYKELLEQEKAIDETKGRKWVDIDGNTNSVDTRPDPTPALAGQTDNQRENAGDDGREA